MGSIYQTPPDSVASVSKEFLSIHMRLGIILALMRLALFVVLLMQNAQSFQDAQAPTRQRDLLVKRSDSVREWPGSAKRFALVIGVDEYEDTQINKLEGAVNDARGLASALVQFAGFPKDQVILLASGEPVERRPTRGNVLRRLSNLRSALPKDGLLLVAFAGHGMERDGRAYLLPADAQVNGDISLLEDTAINVQTMQTRIREAGVAQVIIVLDACRNNPTGRGDSDNKLTQAYADGFNFDIRNSGITAFATLYAAAIGHRAYEYKEKKQGYFTWALVEGLKGAAANRNGEVTLAGLKRYLEEEVPRQSLMDLGKEKQQRPFAVIEGYKPEELVIAAIPFANSGSDGEVEQVVWEKIKDSTNSVLFQAYLEIYPHGKFAAEASRRAGDPQRERRGGTVTTGAILGQVFDFDTDAPVSGAIVSAVNENSGLERRTVTGSDGVYFISTLPVGFYRVTWFHNEYEDSQNRIRLAVPLNSTTVISKPFGRLRRSKQPKPIANQHVSGVIPTILNDIPLLSAEFTTDFFFDEPWNHPNTWEISGGRMLVRGPGAGLLRNLNYASLRMEFDVRLTNEKGVVWIIRARDAQNYYLFQLSGPKGENPNSFRTFVCQNGRMRLLKFEILPDQLNARSFHIVTDAKGSLIEHSIEINGVPRSFGQIRDDTYRFGTVGFGTMDNEEVSIQFLTIVPR